jgi:signal transduction histidine kinase
MTTTSVAYRTARRGVLHRLGADSVFILLSLPIHVLAFALSLAVFCTGVGTLVIFGGLFVLTAALLIARGFADLDRLRIAGVLGRPIPRPTYRAADPGRSAWRRWLTPLRTGQSWLDFVRALLAMPLAVISFSLTVTWWAGSLGGLSYWFWQRWLPDNEDSRDLPELIGLGAGRDTKIWFYLVLGVFMALTLPLVVRVCALLIARPAQTLLSDLGTVRAQLVRSQAQTRAAVSAEATALRRLERDIHDGPQQRLVRLALDLGRAKQQLDADPAVARATIDEAIGQTRETLDELRTLSRGIAPPILTDRGLASALTAVASRCPVPVALRLDDSLAQGGRLPASTETGVYFAVTEALTNVAKHSQAQTCLVTVDQANGWIRIVIRDDGQGGAHLAKGHGLSGLADRIEALGGTFKLDSPLGGPTVVAMEVPCA